MIKFSLPLLYPGLLALLLTGCSSSALRTDAPPQGLPEQWQSTDTESTEPAPGWLHALNDPVLEALVTEALSASYGLAEQRALVRQAEQSLVVAAAPLYPELQLELDAARSGQGSGNAASQFDAGLNLGWELDVWGKLSDSARQASLTLAARQADLASARLGLVSDLAAAWFELQAVEQRQALFSRRLSNLEQNLEIIESGYRLGLGSALDVYLARNDVQSEQARVEAQRQLRIEAVQALQLLLGRYPDGRWQALSGLPVLDAPLPAGVPGTLLRRRPDLTSAWMELLAADAARALAHKQRFPALTISAALGDSASRLPELLSGSLAWSLAGGLTQPLFNAGRLKAGEAQAQARVEQLEQQYLGQVFSAFAEVEAALSRASALQQQYEQYLQAERNALLAEELAFAQYRRGLVEYSTVLEAQRRSLDAQTTVIGLRADLLTNRVALYRALGGDFASTAPESPAAVQPSLSSANLSGDQDA
ncbi:efflux transporter outer membrane subunit [Marinobacterium rhizophilum]|uniref:Efflux transporter outer membrane subunit n=1 Tax=Marinobacterium rhizophilum TaxID=420402 RepID=A0ABY5HGK5_9GAMM|nr:efflux transporter outer membrane subunit [Marinobacterium rhizophilum]UTW10743.1 efflux transporter outer membrane subunit [Marinobacterium rhizophilum]